MAEKHTQRKFLKATKFFLLPIFAANNNYFCLESILYNILLAKCVELFLTLLQFPTGYAQ